MSSGDELDFGGTSRFEVRRCLGRGGMGVVYEAFDRENNSRVALKTIRRLDAQSLYRLKNEFRAVQDIEHPNLVSLGELIEEAGRWFFTMELIEGVDFLSYVWRRGEAGAKLASPNTTPSSDASPRSGGPPPSVDEERLRRSAAQLAAGLFALHATGTVHRDVKPSNALVAANGRLVLLDFGLASPADGSDLSSICEALGTAAYMAPEQASEAEVGPAADWYSFGVVLYEAITGVLPYSGRSNLELIMKKQEYAPPPPRARVPEVAPDLDHLCVDLLRISPRDRPTGSAVLERLGVPVSDDMAAGLAEAFSSRSVTLTQSSPFVGRDAELAMLRAAFENTLQERPQVVSVHGESGLGKTALIREFIRAISCERADLVVLAGRCYERESVPYKAFDGIVDALSARMHRMSHVEAAAVLPTNAALLPRVFPVLARVEAIAQAPRVLPAVKDPHELRSRVFAALKSLLYSLVERYPLMLVIDDLQWADPDSLLLLGELLQPPDAPPLLLLMSSRTAAGAESPGGPLFSTSVDHVRIALGPLDDREGALLAEILLEGGPASATAQPESIAAEADGHPMYIAELVRHLELAGDEAGQRLRLDEAIWKRVSALPETVRSLLELIALAGAPLPEATLRSAAQMAPHELGKQLSLLRVASLARTSGARDQRAVEPYHDRVREAVREHLPPATRRERHARLAVALDAAGMAAERPELLVRHLEGAGQIARAAELAEESARRATRGLAFDRAAELYRTAMRLGDYQGAALRALRIALADALTNAGHCAEAAELYTLAAVDADPGTRLECQRKAAQQLLISGHIESGLDTLRAVLADIGLSIATSPRSALASLLWQRLKLRARGLGWNEKHESQITPEALKRLDVLAVVSTGLGVVDSIRGMAFQARGLLLALETGERTRVAVALCYEACFVAAQAGRGKLRAEALLAEARRAAGPTEDEYLAAWITLTEGFLAYFDGRFAEAVDHLTRAERILRERTVGSVWELNNVRLFQLHSLRLQGSFARLRALRDDYVRDAARRGDRYLETTVRRSNAILCLAADAAEDTIAELTRATWMPPADTFHLQHWYELEARAQMDLYVGAASQALESLAPDFDRLARSLLLRLQTVRTQADWLSARLHLAASTGPGAESRRSLDQAARLARRLGKEKIGYASTWAELVRAGVAARSGQPEAAIERLRAARRLAETYDVGLARAAAHRRLGELLGGERGSAATAEADQWLTKEGIARPDRFVRLIAPGFDPA